MNKLIRAFLLMPLLVLLASACSKEEPSTSALKPRENPTFSPSAASTAPESGTAMTSPSGTGALPLGHPPLGDSGLPPDHGAMMAGSAPAGNADLGIDLHLPPEFRPQPARGMTLQVYSAPKVEGDAADADVAISALGAKI